MTGEDHALFQRSDDQDYSTIYCTCGASFRWTLYDPGLDPWVEKHRPHELARRDERAIASKPPSALAAAVVPPPFAFQVTTLDDDSVFLEVGGSKIHIRAATWDEANRLAYKFGEMVVSELRAARRGES